MQKILGHHSILTTARYTHLSSATDGQARERIEALMNRYSIGIGIAIDITRGAVK